MDEKADGLIFLLHPTLVMWRVLMCTHPHYTINENSNRQDTLRSALFKIRPILSILGYRNLLWNFEKTRK